MPEPICHRCLAQAEIARLEERVTSLRKMHAIYSRSYSESVEVLSYMGVPLRDVFLFIADELNAGRAPWKKA